MITKVTIDNSGVACYNNGMQEQKSGLRVILLDRELVFTNQEYLLAQYVRYGVSSLILKRGEEYVAYEGGLITYANELDKCLSSVVPFNASFLRAARVRVRRFCSLIKSVSAAARRIIDREDISNMIREGEDRAVIDLALLLCDLSEIEITNLGKIVRFHGEFTSGDSLWGGVPDNSGLYIIKAERHPLTMLVLSYIITNCLARMLRVISNYAGDITPEVNYFANSVKMRVARFVKNRQKYFSPEEILQLVVLLTPLNLTTYVSVDCEEGSKEKEIITRNYLPVATYNKVESFRAGRDYLRDMATSDNRITNFYDYSYRVDISLLEPRSYREFVLPSGGVAEDGSYFIGLEIEGECYAENSSQFEERIATLSDKIYESYLGALTYDSSVSGFEIKTVPIHETNLKKAMEIIKSEVYDSKYIAPALSAALHVNLSLFKTKDIVELMGMLPKMAWRGINLSASEPLIGLSCPIPKEEVLAVTTLYLDIINKSPDLARALFGRAISPYSSTGGISKEKFIERLSNFLGIHIGATKTLEILSNIVSVVLNTGRYCPINDHGNRTELRIFGNPRSYTFLVSAIELSMAMFDWARRFLAGNGIDTRSYASCLENLEDFLDALEKIRYEYFLQFWLSNKEKYPTSTELALDNKFSKEVFKCVS
jgi:hypothetical protein